MTYEMTETKEGTGHPRFVDTGLAAVIERLKQLYKPAFNKQKISVRVDPGFNADDPESDVFLITLHMGIEGASTESYYAKFYYPASWEQRVKSEFDATKLLWEHTRCFAPAISVVQPVLCLPEYRCMVTKAQSGKILQEVMKDGRCNMSLIENAIIMYVRWLGILQSIKTGTGRQKGYDVASIDWHLRSRLESCQAEGFISRRIASRLVSASERLIVSLGDCVYEEVASQNTVHLRNILLTEAGICMLDFGKFCYQSGYIDISNFWYALNPINPISISERDGDRLRSLFLQAVRRKFNVENDVLDYFLLYAFVGDAENVAKFSGQNTWKRRAMRLALKIGFRYRFAKMAVALEL